MNELILSYIGACFFLSSSYLRTKPKHLTKSFMASFCAGIIMAFYAFFTYQYGMLVVNLLSSYLALRGYLVWKKRLK